MFNYTALALRQAGRQAGTTARHGIQLAAQNGGKCPLHPALPAAGKPRQGSWAEPLALGSQTPKPWLLGQHHSLNCCAESCTSQNRIAPLWAHMQPRGRCQQCPGCVWCQWRVSKAEHQNIPPFHRGVFRLQPGSSLLKGKLPLLESWDDQKKNQKKKKKKKNPV